MRARTNKRKRNRGMSEAGGVVEAREGETEVWRRRKRQRGRQKEIASEFSFAALLPHSCSSHSWSQLESGGLRDTTQSWFSTGAAESQPFPHCLSRPKWAGSCCWEPELGFELTRSDMHITGHVTARLSTYPLVDMFSVPRGTCFGGKCTQG